MQATEMYALLHWYSRRFRYLCLMIPAWEPRSFVLYLDGTHCFLYVYMSRYYHLGYEHALLLLTISQWHTRPHQHPNWMVTAYQPRRYVLCFNGTHGL